MTFQEKLDAITAKNNSLVCVGLDPDITKMPSHLRNTENAIFAFNKAIIDATHDLVCSYKPNSAFYEATGAEGITQLKMTCDYIRTTYPEIPVILDAKRGDIGSTNEGYVQFAFNYLQVDAITLQPYLGREANEPLLELKDKGFIILCKTSNKGSDEFQSLIVNNLPLYKIVAQKVTNEWNQQGNCMLVVGATYPEELAEVRAIVGDMTLLVPGVGAQGGDVEKTVKAGLNSKKAGIIISSSRGIIYASNEENFAEKSREETEKLRNDINQYR